MTQKPLINSEWKVKSLLFLITVLIYFFYFHGILLHPNAVLSSITGDSLKNYYTFIFHIKNDQGFLHSNGMNFPYGEHVVYTDCIPLLSLILRPLSFTHEYLAGILHVLIFLSFAVTPLLYYTVFRRLVLDQLNSFLISLAIVLLSPQFLKIFAGHHALIFSFVVPLAILYIQSYQAFPITANLLKLFFYNSLLFFIHPYFGLSVTIFTFFSLLIFELFFVKERGKLKRVIKIFLPGILPLLLFQLFLFITDHHSDRPTEPWGSDALIAQPGSLLVPSFGPFSGVLSGIFQTSSGNFEGRSYLGLALILFTALAFILLLFYFRKIKTQKGITAIFLSAFILMLLSFGIHTFLFDQLGIRSSLVNQFRAPGRFSWFMYYCLPLLVFPFLNSVLKGKNYYQLIFTGCSLLFLALNFIEAHSLFNLDKPAYWKDRNFFASRYLNAEEKKVLQTIKELKPQAILPLPFFHTGSEVINRGESNASMIPSFIYSVHGNLPILSNLLSRTSISESRNSVELLNSYKRSNPASGLLNNSPFILLKTNDRLLPDEERLLPFFKSIVSNDSLTVGSLSASDLLRPKISKTVYQLDPSVVALTDTFNNICFLAGNGNKPFTNSSMKDYERAFLLDSNKLASGRYAVSFHYHFKELNYKAFGCHLITGHRNAKVHEWTGNQAIKKVSGLYENFAVFEDILDLEKNAQYEFILTGVENETYRISDFMLRPLNTTVLRISKGDTTINNFPVR